MTTPRPGIHRFTVSNLGDSIIKHASTVADLLIFYIHPDNLPRLSILRNQAPFELSLCQDGSFLPANHSYVGPAVYELLEDELLEKHENLARVIIRLCRPMTRDVFEDFFRRLSDFQDDQALQTQLLEGFFQLQEAAKVGFKKLMNRKLEDMFNFEKTLYTTLIASQYHGRDYPAQDVSVPLITAHSKEQFESMVYNFYLSDSDKVSDYQLIQDRIAVYECEQGFMCRNKESIAVVQTVAGNSFSGALTGFVRSGMKQRGYTDTQALGMMTVMMALWGMLTTGEVLGALPAISGGFLSLSALSVRDRGRLLGSATLVFLAMFQMLLSVMKDESLELCAVNTAVSLFGSVGGSLLAEYVVPSYKSHAP